jgi:CRISPR-associated exonuclease Cas4
LLSGIQHFAFCKRQWALVHIDQQWSENYLTATGRQLHKKVDDPYADEVRDDVRIVHSAQIVSRTLGLYGVADIIEYRGDIPTIVEYKRGVPKSNDCDRLQLAAQVMCLEEMNGIKIDSAAIFYGQTRRREQVRITDELRKSVRNAASEMHELFARHAVVPAIKTPSCAACSLYEICRPDAIGKNARKYILNLLNEETS